VGVGVGVGVGDEEASSWSRAVGGRGPRAEEDD